MAESKEKLFIKFIRSKAKTNYHKAKKDICFICESSDKLELHHIMPLSSIVFEYLRTKGIRNPSNDPELREEILSNCSDQIFKPENLVTLCKLHHKNLHQLFGKTYSQKLASKVSKFLNKQRSKYIAKQMEN